MAILGHNLSVDQNFPPTTFTSKCVLSFGIIIVIIIMIMIIIIIIIIIQYFTYYVVHRLCHIQPFRSPFRSLTRCLGPVSNVSPTLTWPICSGFRQVFQSRTAAWGETCVFAGTSCLFGFSGKHTLPYRTVTVSNMPVFLYNWWLKVLIDLWWTRCESCVHNAKWYVLFSYRHFSNTVVINCLGYTKQLFACTVTYHKLSICYSISRVSVDLYTTLCLKRWARPMQ